MAPISAERDGRIEDEFANIEYEADLLRRYLETFAGSEPADDLDYFQRTHTSSSATEKIYSGLERIVEIICVALYNQPAGKGDSNWHKQLLVRASQANPDFRGAILSASTFEALDRLLVFGTARGTPISRPLTSMSLSNERGRALRRLHC